MRSITAMPCADAADFLIGNALVQISIGPAQELLVLSSEGPTTRGMAQQASPPGPMTYHVHRLESSGWKLVLALPPSKKFYRFVQPLSNARWLFVADGAKRHELNADIFTEEGTIISSFHAGDGIEHVQTTLSGETWIGYFDEGIFGRGELAPSGLVCVTESGAVLLRYWQDIAEPRKLAFIYDCYALNAESADIVWTSYYSNFPIVRLRDKAFDQAWTDFPSRAVRSFAVDGDRLLMVPAYREEGLLYSVDLGSRTVEEISVLKPTGEPLWISKSCGRDSILFISAGEADSIELYSIDLSTIE